MNVEHEIVLAGNPNCGKTSVFNLLCGTHQKVGNYPGVTVEKKSGLAFEDQGAIRVTDLPGAYSLQPSSMEEQVARRWLLDTVPRLIVNVVDGTNLHRSLYLSLQLAELGRPAVLLINMADEMQREGMELDVKGLEKELGLPILLISANQKSQRERVLEFLHTHLKAPPVTPPPMFLTNPTLEDSVRKLASNLPAHLPLEWGVRPEWIALSALEEDEALIERLRGLNYEAFLKESASFSQRVREIYDETPQVLSTEARHQKARYLVDNHLSVSPRQPGLRESLDGLLLSRVFGLPIFLGIVYLTFQLVFTVGAYPMDWIDALFGWLGDQVSMMFPKSSDSDLKSFLLDGVIGGVGGVIIFLPNIVLLFTAIAFLEGTGYMARAAFLMDRIMRGFGLHGKSFMPLASGLGCTVPSIMATRILENRSDRMITLFMLPMVSCSARLPIYGLLIPVFFPLEWRGAVLMATYLAGFAILVLGSWVLRVTRFQSEPSAFMMELPPLRMPTLLFVVSEMWHRCSIYLKKAGTIILACSILLWGLARWPGLPVEEQPQRPDVVLEFENNPSGVQRALLEAYTAHEMWWPHAKPYQKTQKRLLQEIEGSDLAEAKSLRELLNKALSMERYSEFRSYVAALREYQNRVETKTLAHSFAGKIGRLVEPVFTPVGFDWKISTALIGAVAAKEVFVSQFAIIYGLGSDVDLDAVSDLQREQDGTSLGRALKRDVYPQDHARAGQKVFHPLVAISLMVFCLVSTPCMSTIAVTIRETGSYTWGLWQFFGFTILAWILAFLLYQGGMLLGFGP